MDVTVYVSAVTVPEPAFFLIRRIVPCVFGLSEEDALLVMVVSLIGIDLSDQYSRLLKIFDMMFKFSWHACSGFGFVRRI